MFAARFLVHVLLFSVVQCSDNCTIVLAPAGICRACNAVSALEHCSSIGIRGVLGNTSNVDTAEVAVISSFMEFHPDQVCCV
jgi:hypothetical protein